MLAAGFQKSRLVAFTRIGVPMGAHPHARPTGTPQVSCPVRGRTRIAQTKADR